jgi:hypothetical protein
MQDIIFQATDEEFIKYFAVSVGNSLQDYEDSIQDLMSPIKTIDE